MIDTNNPRTTFGVRFDAGRLPIPADLAGLIDQKEWDDTVFISFDYFPEICTDDQNWIEICTEMSGALYKEIHSSTILLDKALVPSLKDEGIKIETLSDFTGKIGFAYFQTFKSEEDAMFFFSATFFKGMFVDVAFIEKVVVPSSVKKTSINSLKESVMNRLKMESHPAYRYLYVPWAALIRVVFFCLAYVWNLPLRFLNYIVFKILTPI